MAKPSHSTSIVQTQLYYDEFPLGVLLPWHKSFYARTQTPLKEGTADSDSTDYLVDSGADFISAGISAGDIVYNVNDKTYSAVVNVATTALELSNDAFDNGNEDYQVFKEPIPPVGWMEYTNEKITDKESPFYGMTPEDIIGEERFLRFCEVSGINQDHQFEDHTHSFNGVNNILRWVGSGGTLSPSTGSTVNGEIFSIGNASSGNRGTETRPINISFVAIFKYKKAPAQTDIFQATKVITDQINITDFASMVEENAVALPSNDWELFELNTPDCISSKGRVPSRIDINYQPAKATLNGNEIVDNSFIKWPGRGCTGIFAAQLPDIRQPEDLSNTGGWTYSNCSAVLSDYYVQGHRLTKLTQSAAGGSVYDTSSNIADNGSGYCILRNGNIPAGELTKINMNSYADCDITITWSTKTVTDNTYVDSISNWLDDNTVEIYWKFGGTVDTCTDWRIYVNTAGSSGDYIYAGAANVQSTHGFTPYTRLGREEGKLEYPFKLTTGKFSFGFWFYPLYCYDNTYYPMILCFKNSTSDFFELYWHQGNDKFYCDVKGLTNQRSLISQQFDDGTSYDTLNQWLYFAGAIDPTTGSTAGSWFKVYGDNGISETADDAWNDVLDSYNGFIPLLSIGRESAGTNEVANGWFTDFIIRDNYLWTEAEADEHYSSNKPYYSPSRLLGNNGNFKLDKFGNAYFRNLTVG